MKHNQWTELDMAILKNPCVLSVDRIDSSKGYTQDNIVLCTWIVNKMKNNTMWFHNTMWYGAEPLVGLPLGLEEDKE